MEASVDTHELEAKVKDMYRHVAEQPQGKYHFELGRPLAEHLGYPADILDRVPDGACESFAGVGYFFDLAELEQHLDAFPSDREVIAYCRGPFCVMAHEAVHRLRAAGLPARRLEEGWPEWHLAELEEAGAG